MNTAGPLRGIPMRTPDFFRRAVPAAAVLMLPAAAAFPGSPQVAQILKRLPITDTLDVFLQGNPAGRLTGTLAASGDHVVNRLNLVVTMAAPGGEQRIVLDERREYDSDGRLENAFERMESPAGSSSWKLGKDAGGSWRMTVTTAGIENSRILPAVHDDITSLCELYNGIAGGTLRRDVSWTDTAVELTSGQQVVTETRCIRTPAGCPDSCWEFICTNSLVDREELWRLDRRGKTVYRDIYPYTAKKPSSGTEKASVPGATDANTMFEMMKIPVPHPLKKGSERVAVIFGGGNAIDSSVARFYEKQGSVYLLRQLSLRCSPGKMNLSAAEKKAFCAPTATLQSQHQAIRHLADSLAQGKKDPCVMVKAFNHYIYQRLEKKNVATFSSALETLQAGYGDCGEHAVLLAALLRAAGIPARVVFGVLYVARNKGYYYHAWVTANTGSWIFADPSHDCFPAGADRIPLVIDDDGTRAISIAKVMGRITISHVPVQKKQPAQ